MGGQKNEDDPCHPPPPCWYDLLKKVMHPPGLAARARPRCRGALVIAGPITLLLLVFFVANIASVPDQTAGFVLAKARVVFARCLRARNAFLT